MKKLTLILSLLLMLSGCTLPGLGGRVGSDGIVVVSGVMTERQILGEINLQMINHYYPEIDTAIINNLGSTMLILQSLTGKDANIAGAMYTGTSLTGELGLEATTDPEEALELVVQGYYDQYDMLWLPTYGFENTYAFMVRKDFALEHGIETISDLEPIAHTLNAGVDPAWIPRQGDGYEDFVRVYEFDFNQVYPMEIGLVYDAVVSDEMDLVLGYSTDGRVQSYDLQLLQDDRQLFPPYDASPLMSMELYETNPEILDVLLKLEGAIDNDTMQELNRLSDEDRIEPNVVAREFLEEHNYFEDVEPKDLSENPLYTNILKDVNQDD